MNYEFTYEISKFILESIDSNPEIIIDEYGYPRINIKVKHSKYYCREPDINERS